MIYVFGKGKDLSFIFDGSILSEQDKIGSITVKELPKKEEKEGYNSYLFLDKDNTLKWIHEKIEEKSEEEKIEEKSKEEKIKEKSEEEKIEEEKAVKLLVEKMKSENTPQE
jgi:hypothetical protein